MYKECIHNLRPKLKLFKSYEKAQEEVERLRLQLYPALGDTGAGGDVSDSKKLSSINENESEDVTEDYTSEAIVDSDDEDTNQPRSEAEDLQDDVNYLDYEDISQADDLKSEESKEPEKTEDDLQFELMFDKMATDSIQERMKESAKVNTRDIPVPMTTKTAKKTYEQLLQQDAESKQTEAVPFVLMVRNTKSGKQQFKNFVAPSDSELAVNLKMQEQKIKEEHEKVKRLTLNITERLEEEDYQDSLLQKSTAFAKRAPKPQKFKHQKGVPDVTTIFN